MSPKRVLGESWIAPSEGELAGQVLMGRFGNSGAAKALLDAVEARRSAIANGDQASPTSDFGTRDVPVQLEATFNYLRDIDERLSSELALVSQSLGAVLASLDQFVTQSGGVCRGSGSSGSSRMNARGSGTLQTPLIGRPASKEVAENRYASATSGVLSRSHSKLNMLDVEDEVHVPATSSSMPFPSMFNRRPSNASMFGGIARSETGSQLQIPSALQSRRPSNASQLPPSWSTGDAMQLPGPKGRRPSADFSGLLEITRKTSDGSFSATEATRFHNTNKSQESLSVGASDHVENGFADAPAAIGQRGRRPSAASIGEMLRLNAPVVIRKLSGESLGSNSGPNSEEEEDRAIVRSESPMLDRQKPGFRAQWSLCPDRSDRIFDDRGCTSGSVMSLSSCTRRASEVARASLSLTAKNEQVVKQSPRCIIMPSDRFRLIFDMLIVVATVLATFLAPLGFVYFGDHDDITSIRESTWLLKDSANLFLHFADCLWTLEIFLNFRTAYARRGMFVSDPWRIASQYARTWLPIDVIAAWPLILSPPGSEGPMLIIKLLRVAKLVHILDKLQKELRWSALLPMKVLLMTLLPAHLFACLWRMARRSDNGGVAVDAQGFAMRDTWWSIYIQDTYWVMMTVTTVGYGDITPDGLLGRLLAIVTMTLAPFFNGAIVSLLTHVTKGFFNDPVQDQIIEASKLMRRRRVPVDLQRRVEHNLRTQLKQESSLAFAPSLLTKLSPSMQRELTLELLSSTVLNFPLFFGAPAAFIADIAQAHTWVHCSAGDLVVEAGQLEQEVVFVVVGCLVMFAAQQTKMRTIKETVFVPGSGASNYEDDRTSEDAVPDDESGSDHEIHAGAWFGEAALFCDGRVRSATVFAREDAELAVLQSSDYHRIVRKYPQLLATHVELVNEIQAGLAKLSDIAHVPPPPLQPRGRRVWDYFRRRGSSSSEVYDVADFEGIGPCR